MSLRPLVTTAAAAALALSAATLPASASARADHLVLTVTGVPGGGGSFELFCHPAGGDHPDATTACDRLDELTVWGSDPFSPFPSGRDRVCTEQYGGPAKAHLTGSWAGRPVDTRFDRVDGCAIARWDALVPLLPAVPPS